MTPTEALGAGCWAAREWLDRPGLDDGASADMLCYYDDPRYGPEVLHRADVVVLRGGVYCRPNLASRSALDGIRVETIGRYPIDVGGLAVAHGKVWLGDGHE